MYREDREVNLALKVADLLEVNTGRWNRELVYETFAPGDADRIMLLQPMMNREDSIIWGFTKNGIYSTRSVMNNSRLEMSSRRAVPWVLWQIWKARNSVAFTNTSLSPRQAVMTAFEEAELWFVANSPHILNQPHLSKPGSNHPVVHSNVT
ncbi:unnamed protein product [Brassica rapa]|uniref:Reverse transcriptase zinc-binding domain-containing protein n=1 Tax=Brassica campestris TaxID=3711 RepID=A0A3P5ZGG6_BRACM|nr:unnamed protein product [Brassica rapa]VDC71871.1 unnamed protein product [Brassica rapa]